MGNGGDEGPRSARGSRVNLLVGVVSLAAVVGPGAFPQAAVGGGAPKTVIAAYPVSGNRARLLWPRGVRWVSACWALTD